jgi:hypothetical protein
MEPPFVLAMSSSEEHPDVIHSQREWLNVRRSLNGNRVRLAHAVAGLYEAGTLLPGTGLLVHPDWLPSEPVPLDRIVLERDERDPAPAIVGTDEVTTRMRPMMSPGRQFQRYSHAIRSIDKPKLFVNRLAWRLACLFH